MLVIIIIFLIAIISLFGMMMFQAWKIKKIEAEKPLSFRRMVPEIYFRHVEKIMLHLTKYIIQWIVLVVIKYWFIVYTKTKKRVGGNWPKIYKFFKRKATNPQKISFIRRAILESKIKIRSIKEKVRREHGD